MGFVNYHFRSKNELVRKAVGKVVNGIASELEKVRDKIKCLTHFLKLDHPENIKPGCLFFRYQTSEISILSDIENPEPIDNR